MPPSALPDMDAVAALMHEVAESEIMPRFCTLEADDVWHKKPGDIATTADIESERRLVAALAARVPGSVVLAEESAPGADDIRQCLAGEAPVWIVDPLDGTANFAAGRERFAVIVAYWHSGAVRAGWIEAPALGRRAMAEEGGGAWSDGVRLGASTPTRTEAASGSLGRRLREDEAVAGRFGKLVNQRCCGLQYLMIAAGESHFAHYRGLRPWDHAAGDLIVREAGGVAKGLDGKRYDPVHPDRNGLLTAGSAGLWRQVADAIRPVVLGMTPPR